VLRILQGKLSIHGRLVKGASEGHGLGNEFLSHIQQVDGLFQLVRAFENDQILHTEGLMDPVRDLAIISNELIAKDYAFVSKRAVEISAKVKKFEQNRNVSQEA
jgi:obg-like ATPase 1